ncbi:MAG TPA: hypothetical protein VKE24_05305 [Candidatus Acidoferrales bacterium]|nr:hypothetical protein [Candidatus Acidoferrales bacterium]
MADSKSVVIKLTNEQREAIKRATGKDIPELKVEALEGRVTPLVMESEAARKAPFAGATEVARKAPLGGNPDEAARKAPFSTE